MARPTLPTLSDAPMMATVRGAKSWSSGARVAVRNPASACPMVSGTAAVTGDSGRWLSFRTAGASGEFSLRAIVLTQAICQGVGKPATHPLAWAAQFLTETGRRTLCRPRALGAGRSDTAPQNCRGSGPSQITRASTGHDIRSAIARSLS